MSLKTFHTIFNKIELIQTRSNINSFHISLAGIINFYGGSIKCFSSLNSSTVAVFFFHLYCWNFSTIYEDGCDCNIATFKKSIKVLISGEFQTTSVIRNGWFDQMKIKLKIISWCVFLTYYIIKTSKFGFSGSTLKF